MEKTYRKAGMLYIISWLALAVLFVGIPCGTSFALSKMLSMPDSTLSVVAIVGVALWLFAGTALLSKQKIRCPECGQARMEYRELDDSDRSQVVICSNCGFEAKTGIQKDTGP